MKYEQAHPVPDPGSDAAIRFAQTLLNLRKCRNDVLGAPLFADPAWDMLIELFVLDSRNVPVGVSGLSYSAGIPPSTAIRYIQKLIDMGVVTRRADPSDRRIIHVTLTPDGRARMIRILNQANGV